MIIETRAFGSVEIDDERVMQFVGPMLGLEGADRYVLMDLNPQSPFKILQRADQPDACFLVADPAIFFPGYEIKLSSEEVADLALDDPAKAAVMVVITIRDNGAKLTANLMAPVIVNSEKLLGKQVVLRGTEYKIDEPLPLDIVPSR